MVKRLCFVLILGLTVAVCLDGCRRKSDSVDVSGQPGNSSTVQAEGMTSGTAETTDTVYYRDPSLEVPPCIAHGWLPLSKGLVGELIMTKKDEVRLYRPTDPNTSSGINYGEVFVTVLQDNITSVPFKPRMYRNELIAKLPREVTTLPLTLIFETTRISEGPETLEYEIYEFEQPREAGSTRMDTYAFKLREEMGETYADVQDAAEKGDWQQIEITVRLFNDQSKRFIELTKNTLNPQQTEAAKLLLQNTRFVLDCVESQTKPEIKPLVKQFGEFLKTLESMD